MSDQGSLPLKVMYLLNGLGTGGAERSLTDLIPLLRAREIDLIIVCLFKRSIGVQSGVLATTEVHFLEGGSWLGRIRGTRRLLRRLRPNLLHTTLFESDIVGRFAAIGTGIPVLSSLVNTSYDNARLQVDPQLRKNRVLAARWLDGWTARHLAVRFHALTTAVKDAGVRQLGLSPQRITVIGRGRDLTRLGEASPVRRLHVRAGLGLPATDEVVLTVGRHEFQKGQIFLIEAMAELRQQREHLRLLIAGREGNATSQLAEAIHRLGLGNHVSLLGHRADIGDLLAAADVFCFPSVYEGFGGAAIEAMALGTPIVASDLPALREVIGDTAIFVPSQSAPALAGAIRDLLENPSLGQSLASAAKVRVKQHFSLDQIAGEMARLYREVAGYGRRTV